MAFWLKAFDVTKCRGFKQMLKGSTTDKWGGEIVTDMITSLAGDGNISNGPIMPTYESLPLSQLISEHLHKLLFIYLEKWDKFRWEFEDN